MEEQEKFGPTVIEEEDISEATEEIEKLHRFDKKEIEGKGDESKSIQAIEAQNK